MSSATDAHYKALKIIQREKIDDLLNLNKALNIQGKLLNKIKNVYIYYNLNVYDGIEELTDTLVYLYNYQTYSYIYDQDLNPMRVRLERIENIRRSLSL